MFHILLASPLVLASEKDIASARNTVLLGSALLLGSGRVASSCDRVRQSLSTSLAMPAMNASTNALPSGNSKSVSSHGSGSLSSGRSKGMTGCLERQAPRKPESEENQIETPFIQCQYIYLEYIWHILDICRKHVCGINLAYYRYMPTSKYE